MLAIQYFLIIKTDFNSIVPHLIDIWRCEPEWSWFVLYQSQSNKKKLMKDFTWWSYLNDFLFF